MFHLMRIHGYSPLLAYLVSIFTSLVLLGLFQPAIAKSTTHILARPSVEGSFPSDGSKGLIRNVFVSLGVVLPNEGFFVDVKTLSDSTVKLFPAHMPDSLVEGYVTTDPEIGNITFEPVKLLSPNTAYVFELTSLVKDQSGSSFVPYSIRFTTGERALQKHITFNKPRLDPNSSLAARVSFRPDISKLIQATSSKSKKIEVQTSTEQKGEEKSSLAVKGDENMSDKGENNVTVKANNEALAKEIASSEATNSAKEKTKNKQPNNIASSETKASEPAKEASNQPKDQEPEDTEALASNTEADLEKAKKEEAERKRIERQKEAEKHINFPKKVLTRNSKMPILFSTKKGGEVKLMIRAKSGKVVKRKTGDIKPGRQRLFLSLEGVPPGDYVVLIKVAEYAMSQRIKVK